MQTATIFNYPPSVNIKVHRTSAQGRGRGWGGLNCCARFKGNEVYFFVKNYHILYPGPNAYLFQSSISNA